MKINTTPSPFLLCSWEDDSVEVFVDGDNSNIDPKLWDPGDDHLSQQNPGDNTKRFRTIVSLLRP